MSRRLQLTPEKDHPVLLHREFRWPRPGECSRFFCYQPATWDLVCLGVGGRLFCDVHGPDSLDFRAPHWVRAFTREAQQPDLFGDYPVGWTGWRRYERG